MKYIIYFISFKLYCQCPFDESKGLYFGDIVWISHFERENFLEYKPYNSDKKGTKNQKEGMIIRYI